MAEVLYCGAAVLVGFFAYLGGRRAGFQSGFTAGADAYRRYITTEAEKTITRMKTEMQNERNFDEEL
jgi:hypothetical protein